MCRLAGYLGPPLGLNRFLLEPPHSLLRQSWQPREMRTALMNADGFGIGWFDAEDRAAAYRLTHPIWSDPNLTSLGRTLVQPLWLAYVRSATEDFGTGLANTQPFIDEELIFFHNGFITPFGARIRGLMRRWLHPDIESGIDGTTDSEYLFACLRQHYRQDQDASLEHALRMLVRQLEGWLDTETMLLALLISDGRRLYGLRVSSGADAPSLYYTTDDETFPGGQLIASEPLTESEYWRPVPAQHLLILDPDEPPALEAL